MIKHPLLKLKANRKYVTRQWNDLQKYYIYNSQPHVLILRRLISFIRRRQRRRHSCHLIPFIRLLATKVFVSLLRLNKYANGV